MKLSIYKHLTFSLLAGLILLSSASAQANEVKKTETDLDTLNSTSPSNAPPAAATKDTSKTGASANASTKHIGRSIAAAPDDPVIWIWECKSQSNSREAVVILNIMASQENNGGSYNGEIYYLNSKRSFVRESVSGNYENSSKGPAFELATNAGNSINIPAVGTKASSAAVLNGKKLSLFCD